MLGTVVLPWQQLHPIRLICKMHIIWCVQARARPEMHEPAHTCRTQKKMFENACFYMLKKNVLKTNDYLVCGGQYLSILTFLGS